MNNIVFFDGECGFCNHWVQWILKRDQKHVFRFASLQGRFGQHFLTDNNFPVSDFQTLYFLRNWKIYTKLGAVREIGMTLGGIYRIFWLQKFLPKPVSDFIYDTIARNRKRIMGEKCLMLTDAENEQFVA